MGLLARLTSWLHPNSDRANEPGAGGPMGGPRPSPDEPPRPATAPDDETGAR